jgi:NADPH-dependent curcumin reductase CurA
MTTGRELRLMERPPGRRPVPGRLDLVEVTVPEPGPGQALVRNLYQAVDPGLLLRQQDIDPPDSPDYDLGVTPWGHTLGEVVTSADPALQAGDIVLHLLGWREYAVADAAQFEVVETARYPSVTHYLSSAIVAYAGLGQIDIRPGDVVVVASAAGAVGSVVGQLARLRGARQVIGSVGSPGKAELAVGELGFDRAFDYHDGWPSDLGFIDVFFDTVGGWQLDEALAALNFHGRIVKCGGTYEIRNDGNPYMNRNIELMVSKRLTMRGFFAFDDKDLVRRFEQEFPPLVTSGQVVLHETIVEGGLTELMPTAEAQLAGAFSGRVLLRL